MQKNPPDVTALERHTSFLFFSVSKFQQKRSVESIDNCSETFA